MIKHFFFDVDGTLTRSRSLMAEVNQPIFERLCHERDVIAVTGAQFSQIQKQIPERFTGMYYALSQSGNHALSKNGEVLWSEKFTPEQKEAIFTLIEKIRAELNLHVKDESDLVEDRGSQISYSLIGHHEDISKKEAFDPGAKKRVAIMERHAEDIARLREAGADVRAGGTTCLDFTEAGKHKGYNVIRLIEHEGWKKDECVYVGDALFPGGNDETVIGVIPTRAVKGPEETFAFIESELGKK